MDDVAAGDVPESSLSLLRTGSATASGLEAVPSIVTGSLLDFVRRGDLSVTIETSFLHHYRGKLGGKAKDGKR